MAEEPPGSDSPGSPKEDRGRYRRRVRTTRALFAIAAVVYPLFWLLREGTQPEHHDPFELRLLVSAAALALLALSYSERFGRKWLHPSVMALVYLITGHFFYLLHANHLAPDYLIGLLVVLGAVNAAAELAFQSRGQLLAYLASVMAAGLLATTLAVEPRMPVAFVLFILLTAGGLAYVALDAHLSVHRGLWESRRRLETLVQGAPVLMWTAGADGRIESMWGREVESLVEGDLVGRRIGELFGPDGEVEAAARTAAAGLPTTAPATAGGREFDTWHVPRRNDDGQIHGTIGVATDVTERVVAERDLRRRESQLAEAQAIARLGSWEWDLEADRVVWSDELHRIFGVERGSIDLTYGAFLERVHAEDRERVARVVQEGVEKARPFEFEARIVRPDGELRWLHGKGRVEADDGGRVARMAGTAQDVSDHRQVQDMLRQAQKMEAIGRVASGMAHNFNNVLTSVIGYCELLSDRITDPVGQSHLAEVKAAARRASELVSHLMVFGRSGEFQIRPVDVNEVVTGVLGMLRGALGDRIRIVTDLAPGPGWVRADRSGIEQILMNLAVNARDAMTDGGVLRISTAPGIDGPPANLPADRSYMTIEVEDDGCGMDRETRERVFEPFFTTKPPGDGTGLGLASVYWIVDRCGGGITVDSEPGRGTTFRIHLATGAPDPSGDPKERPGARTAA